MDSGPAPRGASRNDGGASSQGLLAMTALNSKQQKATTMNDMVLQSLDNGLLTITMNRPDRRNALNPDMTRGLVEAARRAAEAHGARAVLLKGAGGPFCVG